MIKLRLWGDSAKMSEREQKKLVKFLRSSPGYGKMEFEFVIASEKDLKGATTKMSSRGGVKGDVDKSDDE